MGNGIIFNFTSKQKLDSRMTQASQRLPLTRTERIVLVDVDVPERSTITNTNLAVVCGLFSHIPMLNTDQSSAAHNCHEAIM